MGYRGRVSRNVDPCLKARDRTLAEADDRLSVVPLRLPRTRYLAEQRPTIGFVPVGVVVRGTLAGIPSRHRDPEARSI
jgi:hypothetical protein